MTLFWTLPKSLNYTLLVYYTLIVTITAAKNQQNSAEKCHQQNVQNVNSRRKHARKRPRTPVLHQCTQNQGMEREPVSMQTLIPRATGTYQPNIEDAIHMVKAQTNVRPHGPRLHIHKPSAAKLHHSWLIPASLPYTPLSVSRPSNTRQ